MKKFNVTTMLALLAAFGLALSGMTVNAQTLAKKTSIVEAIALPSGRVTMDNKGVNNETPQRFYNAGGTGFKWGGYFPESSTAASNTGVQAQNGIWVVYNWIPGLYAYTVFSSGGTATPDQYIDLSAPLAQANWRTGMQVTSLTGQPAAGVKIRWMLRARSGNATQWYISSPVALPNPIPATATPLFSVLNALSWYAIDATVNTNLSQLVGADEMPLTWAASSTTPNFSQVDGGGWYMEQGQDVQNTGNAFKPNGIGWADTSTASLIKTVASPANAAYFRDITKLVLGLGVTSGKLTLNSISDTPLTIKNVTLLSGDGRITMSPAPSVPATLTDTTALDVNFNFAQVGTEPSTATLKLTYNFGALAGDIITTMPITGRGIVDGTIYESFAEGTSGNVSRRRDTTPNETLLTMNPPTAGYNSTGFPWGGYSNATTDNATPQNNRDMVGFNGQRLVFFGAYGNDAAAGGAYKGSYAYGLFDTMGARGGPVGGLVIDRTVDLHRFNFYSDNIPSGAQIRWLIRDDTNKWFISKNIISLTSDMTNSWVNSLVEGFSGWYLVDNAATTYMEALPTLAVTPPAVLPVVPIAEPTTLATGTPNIHKITGFGVYVEQGNTDPSNTPLTFNDINLISQPKNGDTLQITAAPVSDTIKVQNRRLPLLGLTFNELGSESAITGVDVTVSPGTAGLQNLILMSDPNANGLPDDGTELTTCQLDGNGTVAHLTFRSGPFFTKMNSPQQMCLVGVFDDSASSKTYSFSISQSAWKQNGDAGGADNMRNVPNPLAANVAIAPLTDQTADTTGLFDHIALAETFNSATAGALPSNVAPAPLTGTDVAWTLTQGTGWVNPFDSGFVSKNGSMTFGAEVTTMALEPAYNGSARIDSSFLFTENFDPDSGVKFVKVDFDLAITSTTKVGAPAHLSGRVNGESANITVRLGAFNNTDAYNFTFYPLQDAWRYIFGVSCSNNGINYATQFAPNNVLAYSNNNGIGTYKFTMYLAPLTSNATLAKVVLHQVEANKDLTWMTVIDGKIANLRNFRVGFGAYPNAFVDNLKVTTFNTRLNPVKNWIRFE